MKFYIVGGAAGVLFIAYLYIAGIAKQFGLVTFLKSLANCYGLFLIIVLLGYSLITIPRSQSRTANYELQIKYLYFRTGQIHVDKKDAYHRAEQILKKIYPL